MRYLQRIEIWESNFGRDAGWVLEVGQTPIARLTNPAFEDMFWDSYDLEFLPNEIVDEATFFTADYWNNVVCGSATWRNAYFDLLPKHALPGRPPQGPEERVAMRGLFIDIRPPGLVGRMILNYRSRRGMAWSRQRSVAART